MISRIVHSKDFAHQGAELILVQARATLETRSIFRLGLTGGRSPRAIHEAMVAAAAKAGARLVLGPRAVLTPLGRDRARAAGVEIVKER